MATNTAQIERTAEPMVNTAQQGAKITTDYAVKAQKLNAEILQRTAEVWIEGFHKQMELTRKMAKEISETPGEEGQDPEEIFQRWGFPLWWTAYTPFTVWRERMQAVQQAVETTKEAANEQAADGRSTDRSQKR